MAALWTVLLLLAGLSVARRLDIPLRGDLQVARFLDLSRLLVALAWGFGVVPFLAFVACLFLRIHLRGWMVLSLAAASAASAWWLPGSKARPQPRALLRSIGAKFRENGSVLGASAGIGLLWFFRYDASMIESGSCFYEAIVVALGRTEGIPEWAVSTFRPDRPSMDILGASSTHARLGTIGVSAGAVLGYGGLGGRVLRLICGTMVAIAGWMIGRSVGERAAWGWFGLAVAGLNPYVLAIPKVDENILALGIGASLVPFLLSPPRRWLVPGVLAGLLVCIRHEMLAAMAAPVLAAYMGPGRLFATATFAMGFVLMTLPENIHHYLMFGTIFGYEHNLNFPPLHHSFLGASFEWRTAFNWPLLEQVVRTPHNPFPMFVMWPLFLAKRMGLLLFVLMAFGFFAIWRMRRREAVLWALWSVFFIAGVAIQESWDFQNKMGAMVTVSLSFAAWLVAGTRYALARPIIGVFGVLAVSLVARISLPSLAEWRAPQDSRYYKVHWMAPKESKALVDFEARRLTRGSLFPDMESLDPLWWLDPRGWLSDLRDEMGSPMPYPLGYRSTPAGWRAHDVPKRGPPVTVLVDLAIPPTGEAIFVRNTLEEPDVDMVGREEAVWIPNIHPGWIENPLDVYIKVGPLTSSIVLGPPLVRHQSERGLTSSVSNRRTSGKEPLAIEKWSGVVANLLAQVEAPPFRLLEHPHVGPRIRVRIPSGGLTFVYVINAKAYFFRVHTAGSETSIDGPMDFWGS